MDNDRIDDDKMEVSTERILSKDEILKRGIFKKNGDLWITSIQVAEEYCKDHWGVLDKIRKNIFIPELELFSHLNFKARDYEFRGKIEKMYEMTEAGYYALVTGFTGEKANIARAKLAHDFTEKKKFIKESLTREPDYSVERAIELLTNYQIAGHEQLAHQKSRIDRIASWVNTSLDSSIFRI